MPRSLQNKSHKKKSVNPFAIGGGFLDYCIRQGWIMKKIVGRKTEYYVTDKGIEALKQFGIKE